MAKKPYKEPKSDNDRFFDTTFENIIPIEPGQILVNDDPEGDPHKFAMPGQPDLVPRDPKLAE